MNTKKCSRCAKTKPITEFNKNNGGKFGVRGDCKECQYAIYSEHQKKPEIKEKRNALANIRNQKKEVKAKRKVAYRKWRLSNLSYDAYRVSLRRASIKNATPSWADTAEIKCIYEEAYYMQMHVDHIVPLKSDIVCGLHVPSNMQLLSQKDNCSKGNRWWPDMPEA